MPEPASLLRFAPQRVLVVRPQHLGQDFCITITRACFVLARACCLGFLARLLSMHCFFRSALRGIARCRGRVLRADAGAHPCGGQEGYGDYSNASVQLILFTPASVFLSQDEGNLLYRPNFLSKL